MLARIVLVGLIGMGLAFSTSCFSLSVAPIVNVHLRVVDGDGHPVENAHVAMSFLLSRGGNSFKGFTDSNGFVNAINHAFFGVSFLINKSGYYSSRHRIGNKGGDVTLVLRKKINPIPMYAKKVRMRFPAKKQKFGFDFKRADWVAPYGKGMTAHIYFEFNGERQDYFNYDGTLEVSFPNSGDGILKLERQEQVFESNLKFPYKATDSGYQPELLHSNKRWRPTRKWHRESTLDHSILGYLFRVSSEVDKDGNLLQANYGKLLGEFLFGVDEEGFKDGIMTFTYYYNPKINDKNIEFDINENLFRNLPDREKIREP